MVFSPLSLILKGSIMDNLRDRLASTCGLGKLNFSKFFSWLVFTFVVSIHAGLLVTPVEAVSLDELIETFGKSTSDIKKIKSSFRKLGKENTPIESLVGKSKPEREALIASNASKQLEALDSKQGLAALVKACEKSKAKTLLKLDRSKRAIEEEHSFYASLREIGFRVLDTFGPGKDNLLTLYVDNVTNLNLDSLSVSYKGKVWRMMGERPISAGEQASVDFLSNKIAPNSERLHVEGDNPQIFEAKGQWGQWSPTSDKQLASKLEEIETLSGYQRKLSCSF